MDIPDPHINRAFRYAVALAMLWSAVITASFVVEVIDDRAAVVDIVLREGRAYLSKDMAIRQWAASHGGVLVNSPGHGGQKLMPPSAVIRDIIHDYPELYNASGSSTSFHPIGEKLPDGSWEAGALSAIAADKDEEYGFFSEDGKPYVRVMRPVRLTGGCRNCHTHGATPEGTVVAALEASVPYAGIIEDKAGHLARNAANHALVWVFGLAGLVYAYRRINLHVRRVEASMGALMDSEERVRLLLESTSEPIYGVDREGRCNFTNSACVSVLGYASPADLLGRSMHELIHHSYPDGSPFPINECALHSAALDKRAEHVESYFFWRADGMLFPVECWSHPIMRAGEPIGAVVTFIDITARRATENTLLRTTEALTRAQRIGRLGSWEWDILRGTLTWSEEVYRIFGICREDFQESYDGFLSFVHPEDVAMVRAAVKSALTQRIPYGIDHRVVRPDGEVRYVHEQGEAMWDGQGRAAMMTGTVQDVTERVLAERTISEALAEKTVLLQEIHHRVKNNMQVISSLISLQRGYVRDERDSELMRDTQGRIRAMSHVFERLYQAPDLSRIEFGDIVRRAPVNVLASMSVDPARIRVEVVESGVSLGVDAAVPVALVLNEFLTNAVKHAFPGGASGSIRLSMSKGEGGVITVEAADNGVPLPEGFDPRTSGTLGMRLVDSLTTQLGGTLSFEQRDGWKTFRLTFMEPEYRKRI